MDRNEVGFSILATGTFFLLIGLVLFIDKSLMAAGNILIVLGTLILLNTKIVDVFQLKNIQGIIIFCLGVFVLLYGYTLLGFTMETIGLGVLFYDMIPTFKGLGRSLMRKLLRY